jgi:hypothetical protein
LGVSDGTARNYADDDLLYAYRLRGRRAASGVAAGGGHRRFETASVDALARVLRMPVGAAKDKALDELRRVNRAKAAQDAGEPVTDSGPALEEQGQADEQVGE